MTMHIARLSSDQLGLVTHAQAITAGMTPSAIRHRLRTGRWQRVLPGVYASFSGDITKNHEIYAAVLYGGPSATITGATACQLAGLRYVADDALIRVLVDRAQRRGHAGNIRLISTTRAPSRRPWAPSERDVMSIPIAEPARAVLDTTRVIGASLARAIPRFANGRPALTVPGAAILYRRSLQDVRALICETVQRGLASVDDLATELEEGPRRGSALARKAISDVAAGCLSAPECELRDLLLTSDVLPPARLNAELPGYSRLRPDVCWPERKLIVEVDSIEWHRQGEAYERTEQRRALLASLGWTVIPVSPQRLRARPGEVLAEIEAAYLAAAPAA